jgi:hypothetical protein
MGGCKCLESWVSLILRVVAVPTTTSAPPSPTTTPRKRDRVFAETYPSCHAKDTLSKRHCHSL